MSGYGGREGGRGYSEYVVRLLLVSWEVILIGLLCDLGTEYLTLADYIKNQLVTKIVNNLAHGRKK